MNYQYLDEYVSKYGFNNQTGIDDIEVAMTVNKIRKDRERENETL